MTIIQYCFDNLGCCSVSNIEKSCRRERYKNWHQSFDVLSGRNILNSITYPAMSIKDVRDRIIRSGGRVMVVSTHYSLYNLLITQSTLLGLNLVIFCTHRAKKMWERNRKYIPDNVVFAEEFSFDYIKSSKPWSFFVMADIHSFQKENVYIPFCGHIMMVTAAWARLAKIMKLDIMPFIAHYRNGQIEYLLDYITMNDDTPYNLVADTMYRLEKFMDKDLSLWENRFILSMLSKDLSSYAKDKMSSELFSLAICDMGVMKGISDLLGGLGNIRLTQGV